MDARLRPEEARSAVNNQFRKRSEPSRGFAVRHVGITDRFQAEQAIEPWQRGEIEEIDRRMRETIERLWEEGDTEREQDDREWTEHRQRHKQTRGGPPRTRHIRAMGAGAQRP